MEIVSEDKIGSSLGLWDWVLSGGRHIVGNLDGWMNGRMDRWEDREETRKSKESVFNFNKTNIHWVPIMIRYRFRDQRHIIILIKVKFYWALTKCQALC